jgi:hypothetical protein
MQAEADRDEWEMELDELKRRNGQLALHVKQLSEARSAACDSMVSQTRLAGCRDLRTM